MNPPAPDPVEPDTDPVVVVLDGVGGAGAGNDGGEVVEQTYVLDSQERPKPGRKIGSMLLVGLALVALVGVGWRVLTSDSTASESPPAGSTDAAVAGDEPTDSPDDSADGPESAESDQIDPDNDDQEFQVDPDQTVDGDAGPRIDSPRPGSFPLFGEPVDWTIAVSVGSEIRFVDTTTGSVRSVPLPAAPSEGFDSEVFGGRSIELFGDRIVIGRQGRAIGVPIGPGASIDFGRADAFYVDGTGDQQRLVVVRQIEDSDSSGQTIPEFESQLFGLEGEALGELQRLPEYPSFFSFESVMSGLVGTYRYSEAGFERVSTGYVVAAGDNHAVVHECDEALVCDQVLIDLNEGSRIPIAEIPGGLPFDGFGGAVLSPDGRWLVTEGGFGRLVELETGETVDLDPELRLAQPLAFSPDGRYVVAVRASNVLVFDLDTGDARSVDVEELGTVNERSVAVIFADAP